MARPGANELQVLADYIGLALQAAGDDETADEFYRALSKAKEQDQLAERRRNPTPSPYDASVRRR